MSITGLITKAASSVTGGSAANPPKWLQMLIGGGSLTDSGLKVSEDTALTYTAFWAAINIIAGAIGVLPCFVYRRDGDAKKRDSTHPAYSLLHDRPNPYMDAQIFRETISAHVLVWGNGYAEVERNGAGDAIALWPLMPNRTQPKQTDTGKLYYEVIEAKSGSVITLDADNVLHIRGLGADGFRGYSVVGYHRESIGLGLATQKFGARFFGNGAKPGGILEHPGHLGEQAAKNLRESWNSIHRGLDNSHRVAILEEGMKWHAMGMPMEDAQFLETQKFGLSNIARVFQVPPHMLADLDKATFSNIEHQGIEFVTWSLMRWLKKWENECSAKLLRTSEQQTHYCEFLVDGYLRGDQKTRYQSYAIARQYGWLSKNDVRRFENMNPIDGGDDYTSLAELQASKNSTKSEDANNDNEQYTRIAAAFVPVLDDAIARMVRKEGNDARRAAKKGDDLAAWSEKYFDDYAIQFRSAIIPAIDGAAEAIWATLSPHPLDSGALVAIGSFTAEATEQHCCTAKNSIVNAEYNPDTNGEAERVIRALAALLVDYKGENHAEQA